MATQPKDERVFTSVGGQRYTKDELITKKTAMDLIGLSSTGAFGAAKKAHNNLIGNAEVKPIDEFVTRYARAAVEQYIAERGERGATRDGLKWFMIRVDEASAEALRQQGYEVVKPTDRAKAKLAVAASAATNGANDNQADWDDESEADDEDDEA